MGDVPARLLPVDRTWVLGWQAAERRTPEVGAGMDVRTRHGWPRPAPDPVGPWSTGPPRDPGVPPRCASGGSRAAARWAGPRRRRVARPGGGRGVRRGDRPPRRHGRPRARGGAGPRAVGGRPGRRGRRAGRDPHRPRGPPHRGLRRRGVGRAGPDDPTPSASTVPGPRPRTRRRAAAARVSLAWTDVACGDLAETAAVDPLSGLASARYLRTRLAEIYRAARAHGRAAGEDHALVVLALDVRDWRRVAPLDDRRGGGRGGVRRRRVDRRRRARRPSSSSPRASGLAERAPPCSRRLLGRVGSPPPRGWRGRRRCGSRACPPPTTAPARCSSGCVTRDPTNRAPTSRAPREL